MGQDKVRKEVDTLNSPASYHAGTPESPRLKKVGGLAADRRLAKQKGDSSGDSWGRPTYRFGIPGTASGFYKPAILEEAAKATGVTSAGKQPVTRDIERGYIEDPPIPKDEYVLKATRGQIKFGDANRWEGPRPKLSQTPIEMMNLGAGGMSILAGKQRRNFFSANMNRREHLVETPKVQQGREWGKTNSKVREEIGSIHEGDAQSVRMYERDVRRFMLRSRHEQCAELQARSRQPTRQGSRASESTGSLSVSAERSSSSLQTEKEASVDSISSKKSSRPFVAPTDGLAAIDRVARGHGKLTDMSRSLVSNGSMTLHGGELEPHTNFQVDPSHRPVRRVVTGGAADRLHFSDGSMAVKFPPRVLSADMTKAAKPLPLRDGTPSTIAQRTMRRPATSLSNVMPETLEVKSLTDFHLNGRIPGQRIKTAGDHSYATLREPGSWEKSVEARLRVIEAGEQVNARPDLEAVCEWQAVEAFKREQQDVGNVWTRVVAHRQHELEKVRERHSRTALLQEKSGQTRRGGDKGGMRHSWSGSWTASSQHLGGSLTHGMKGGLSYGLKDIVSVQEVEKKVKNIDDTEWGCREQEGYEDGRDYEGNFEGAREDVQLAMGLLDGVC